MYSTMLLYTSLTEVRRSIPHGVKKKKGKMSRQLNPGYILSLVTSGIYRNLSDGTFYFF